jgi:DNA-binding response OmpR family regulator
MVTGKCPVVLIIEDEHRVRQLISDSLSQFGYAVGAAASAAEAAVLLKAERPDVIVLDVGLPDAAGTAMLEWLQTLRPGVPIIVITGNPDEQLARRLLNWGAFDFIRKPFSIEQLRSVIASAVGTSDRAEGNVETGEL